jgi:hypothetical protein
MNQEVLDFYAKQNIPVGRMVHVGVTKRGLTSGKIREAATAVYQEIHAGTLNIVPIRMAWEIYARAKHLKGDEVSEIQKLKETIQQIVETSAKETGVLNDKIKELEAELSLSWYKKVLRRFKNEQMG